MAVHRDEQLFTSLHAILHSADSDKDEVDLVDGGKTEQLLKHFRLELGHSFGVDAAAWLIKNTINKNTHRLLTTFKANPELK